jgi:formylglycine-generating enzyme required for sulfatase activity
MSSLRVQVVHKRDEKCGMEEKADMKSFAIIPVLVALVITGLGCRRAAGSERTVDLGNDVEMEFVWIESGTFTMGSTEGHPDESPPHEVTISRGYWMAKTPVTLAQYLAFLNDGGDSSGIELADRFSAVRRVGTNYQASGNDWGDDDEQCIVGVSWHGATNFCDWASKKTGRRIRLPTEAEWEYACRAGSTSTWSFGNSAAQLTNYAWFDHDEELTSGPPSVAQKLPNPWGLYDMHGNVQEWCQDRYGPSYRAEPITDPVGPLMGTDRRVCRGSKWFADETGLTTSSDRDNGLETSTYWVGGFRCVMEE